MPIKIKRSYAVVGDRHVHYRQCGKGPVLVLLHASPVSSQVFEHDYIPIFAEKFTCIAPDTPGNGYSDPLPDPESSTIEDYALALAKFLDAINVEKCILYGRHTGALIATAFAKAYPSRAQFIYSDGYPVFLPAEVPAYLGEYLAPIQPDWAGSFLNWLWFRFRDQHVFWPWHQHKDSQRADTDIPELNFIQRGVLDFLSSGNGYIPPYDAAVKAGGRALEFIPDNTPVCFGIRPGDSLYRVQNRLTGLPENVWQEQLARETDIAVQQEFKILLKFAENTPVRIKTEVKCQTGKEIKLFVNTPNGQGFCRYIKSENTAASIPLIMLPQVPGGGSCLRGIQKQLGKHRDVFLIDVPGHGDSLFKTGHSISEYAQHVSDILAELKKQGFSIEEFDLYGYQSGALVAIELGKLIKPRKTVLDDPILLSSSMRKKLTPYYELDLNLSWEGAHLLRLWHHLRDHELWFPWNERQFKNARRRVWEFNIENHYAVFFDCVKQLNNYTAGWDATLSYEAEVLPSRPNTLVVSHLNNPFLESGMVGGLIQEKPESGLDFAKVLDTFLSDKC